MNVVQKQLICLEDLELGTGIVTQDRNGTLYVMHRLDIVPSAGSVEELSLLEGYTRARVGLVNYVYAAGEWVVDPIPLEAFEGLGVAASRDVTGPGNLMHRGFFGLGGPAGVGATGLALGMQASVAATTIAGAPVDELCCIVTLPGETSNLTQLAISTVTGSFYVRRIGAAWRRVAVSGDDIEFNAVKATSVRADSIGTPKE